MEGWLNGNKTESLSQIAVLETWLEGNKTELLSRISTLEGENEYLINALENRSSQIGELEITIAELNSNINTLENRIADLEMPMLHKINFAWSDHHPWFGSPYVKVSGTIFNSGTISATSVVLTVRIYDYNGLLKSEEISFGTIAGKISKNFGATIIYSGDATYITWVLTSF